ncbi:MAG: AAA family ATPase [Caldilineaceae bacterium]|nr:AAA family ATPase [Caldilineaceae bacterium]
MLTIRLLGPTSVLHNDQPLSLKRRKSRALLYYIAAHPQPVTRRQVAALLWSDHIDQTARHNLRTTLYSLRQELGEHLRTEEEWISLKDVEVDARTFVAALEPPKMEDLEAVLALYRGDFLTDFDLPDSEEYENWIVVEREHYRRLAIRGFQLVSRQHEDAGDYGEALASLSRALAIDPFQEDLQRDGLRLHYFAGDRAGAIRRYEEFSRLLETEMDVQPMAETRALYEAILTDELEAPARTQPPVSKPAFALQPIPPTPAPRQILPTAPSGPPFTGRSDELRRLAELHSAHQLILVEGEAGMGKTRLVETYIAHVQTPVDDAPIPLILVGRARQLESRLPYQPMIEALRGLIATPTWAALRERINLPALWWQEIGRLLPELLEPAPAATPYRTPDESRLWEGVFQLLSALAQQQPLILFIDDLHWSDAATLGLLSYVVRQSAAAQCPITFLAASRPPQPGTEIAVLIQALLREDRIVRLQLERLEVDAVMALARWLSPAYGYPLGSWLYRSSEGIPFVLAELVRYIRDEKILLPDGVVNLSALPTTPVVPPTVYTLIQSRLAPLSDAARRVLDAAVSIGREFEFEVVARAAALSDAAALDALDELRQARLISALDDQRFAFDHSLTMEVAYQEMGELRHRLLHRRVAAALESVHQDRLDEVAGLIAQHYAEGDQPEQAAKYARLAGQRAMRLAAWKAAVGFLRQALAATPAAEQPELLVTLGNAELHAGELAAAEETLRAALQLPATQRQVGLLQAALQDLGETLILQADYGSVMELAHAYADHPDPTLRGAAQFMWGATLSLEGLDLDEAARHLAMSVEELQSSAIGATDLQVAHVEFELGNIAAQKGRLEEAIARYERTLELSRPNKSDEKENDDALRTHILAHNNIAYHLHLMGDPRAKEYLEQAIALAREKGMLTVLAYLLSTQGEIALAQEDFTSAESAFNQALAHAQRLNQRERIAGITANLGLLAQARGQHELAIHRFTTAISQADAISSRFLAAQIRLWLAPLLSREEAHTCLTEARAIITTGHYDRLLPQLERLETELVAR